MIVLIAAIFITNRIKCRFIVICTIVVPVIGGAVGLIYVPRSNIGGLIGCYYTVWLIGTLRSSRVLTTSEDDLGAHVQSL